MEEKLLKFLCDERVITQEQYQQVLQESQKSDGSPTAILEQLGILREDKLVAFLSKKFRMPVIDWNTYTFDRELLQSVPESIAVKYTVFPYAFEHAKRGGKLTLAIANPSDVSATDDIAFRTGYTIKPALSSVRAIRQAIQKYYREQLAAEMVSVAETPTERVRTDRVRTERFRTERIRLQEKLTPTGIEEFDALLPRLSSSGEFAEEEADVFTMLDQDNPATKWLRDILTTAVERGISEIHIEPGGQEQRVRFRVHGALHQQATIPDQVGRGIVARLRKMAYRSNMATSPEQEHAPWVGSFSTSQIKGKLFTVFVSFYPTPYGETVLLKIANLTSPRSLDNLGIGDKALKMLTRVLTKSEGLLVVVSPSAQGKTTTLHAIMHQLNRAEMTMAIVDHAVETLLPGISHLTVNPQMGYQDWYALLSYSVPDVLVVENIEQIPLAQLAFEFASGTLVLASLTAHDLADGLCTWLALIRSAIQAQDMPTEKQRQASEALALDFLNGMVAQRLVKTLCPHCKEQRTVTGQDVEFMQALAAEGDGAADVPVYTSKGCRECSGTGYNGQTGLFEVLKPDKYLKQFLLQDHPISSSRLRKILSDMSIDTLKQQGFQKLQEGVTSLEEIRRAFLQ
jgi:type IV pilus assembly protein PilB